MHGQNHIKFLRVLVFPFVDGVV